MKKFTLAFLVPILSVSMAMGACSSKRIKVSFDWNIATDQPAPKEIKVRTGKTYGKLPEPDFTLKGYDFNGWNTRSDAKGEAVTAETIVVSETNEKILYGDWQGRQYTVTFDLNGGNINGATQLAPRTVTFGKMYGAMVIPNNPEKKLSTFRGWYLNPEGTGESITYGTLVKTDHDHTLYAVYKDTRINYEFTSNAELEDFYDNYNSLEYHIEDNKLVVTNPSEDPRGHLVLNSPLRAGSVVDFDLEFVGTVNAEEQVRAAFYTYGGDQDGRKIERGQMGDPTTATVTRKQIRDWYYGQGANNLTSWDVTEWNNGHILLSMNILEDCQSVVMMMEFGRKAVLDEHGDPTGAFEEDKSLWENNKWVFNSIHLHIADYDLLKSEYHFDDAEDIQSFVNPKNLNVEIVDEKLKVSKGTEEGPSSVELETQYLPKGSKVEYEVRFVGDLPTVNNQADVDAGLTVGMYTHGLYPNGYVMTSRDLNNPAPIESEYDKNWFWGGYCINNNIWDPVMLSDEFTRFTTFINEDCFGVNLEFKFGTSDGYFEIDNVRVVQSADIYSRYNFSNEAQLLDFGSPDGLTYELGEDDIGCYVEIKKGSKGEGNFALKTPLAPGQKVFIDIEVKTQNPELHNNSNYFTVIPHEAKYHTGRRVSEDAIIDLDPPVLGTQSWDGGWDAQLTTIECTIVNQCFGVSLQLVFGGSDLNSSFLIRSIDIQ